MTTRYIQFPRDIVEISGPDTRTFLQGLISQDVEKVTQDHAAYGTLLTPQGKFLHDFILIASDDSLLLDTEAGRGAELIGRLSRFKLRAKAELALREDLTITTVFGDEASTALGLEPVPGATLRDGGRIVFVDPRTAQLGARILATPAGTGAFLDGKPLEAGVPEDYDRLRIALAVPDGARDMELEKSTLLESNIDLLHGIDWEKGCYIGQELTARTKYRGLIKRHLQAFRTEGEPPAPGSAVTADGKAVGEIRSTCGDHMLVSIRTEIGEEAALTAENGTILLPLN